MPLRGFCAQRETWRLPGLSGQPLYKCSLQSPHEWSLPGSDRPGKGGEGGSVALIFRNI